MPVITLSDGTQVQAPDQGGESVVDTLKNIGGFLGESGKKAGAAALRTWDSLPGILEKSPILGMKLVAGMANKNKPDILEKAATSIDPGDDGSLWDKAVRGIGSAAALPVLPAGGGAVRAPLNLLLSGGAAGVGAEQGRRIGNSIDSKIAPYTEALGGLLTGGAAGFGMGKTQSPARNDIKKALGPNADFNQARVNNAEARAVGARTNTAAEAFPENDQLLSLAAEARSKNLGNALAQRTQGRGADLDRMGTEFLNRISRREVDPNQVANRTAQAANQALESTRNQRGEGLANRLHGRVIRPQQVQSLGQDLRQVGGMQAREGARDAYNAVADALIGANGQPITNVQELSLAIKSLKDAAKNPNAPIFAGRGIEARDLREAIQAAEGGLGEFSRAFREGMSDFRHFSQEVLTPERQGPIGSLADRNPLTAGQTSIDRLTSLMNGNSPGTIEGTARWLGDPAMSPGTQQSRAADIARALAQQKLKKGSDNPGNAIRGMEGSDEQRAFEALLRGGGRPQNQINDTMQPLRVADRMQPLKGPAGHYEPPTMSLLQGLIRPFRTADMSLTGGRMRGYSDEMARLLANPEGIEELRRIAMFNPEARRMLTARGMLVSPTLGLEKEE